MNVDGYNEDFWKALDELVNSSEIVIDRPEAPLIPDFQTSSIRLTMDI